MNPNWSTPLADAQAGEVLRWYEGLEAQVIDFIRVVPPHGDNLGAWSPMIATILVEACCLIESIWYQFKDDAAKVQGPNTPGARPTLGPYAALYAPLLRLPERTAILRTDTSGFRTPFALWSDLVGGAPFDGKRHVPEWWALYNDSKHHRIEVFPKFTLTRAIDALAGALVVIATVPAFTPALVLHEWLPLDGRPQSMMQDYQQTLQGQHVTPEEWPFMVRTRLFALLIGHGTLSTDINDFRPFFHRGDPRLSRFFGSI
jgi:hypothetical protein